MAEKIHIPQGLKLQREIIVLFNEIVGRTQNLDPDGTVATLNSIGDVSTSSPATGDVLQWNGTQWVDGETPAATATKRGGVKKAAASSNASTTSVSVTSANAATQTGAYVQADVQSIATLANELKSDVNTLVAALNAVVASLNDLKSNLRDSGALDT